MRVYYALKAMLLVVALALLPHGIAHAFVIRPSEHLWRPGEDPMDGVHRLEGYILRNLQNDLLNNPRGSPPGEYISYRPVATFSIGGDRLTFGPMNFFDDVDYAAPDHLAPTEFFNHMIEQGRTRKYRRCSCTSRYAFACKQSLTFLVVRLLSLRRSEKTHPWSGLESLVSTAKSRHSLERSIKREPVGERCTRRRVD